MVKPRKLISKDNSTVKNLTVETEDQEQEQKNPTVKNPIVETEDPDKNRRIR